MSEEDEWAMFKEVGMRELSLQEIEERYTFAGIISQNKNASVRLAIHNVTGDQVAMKILNKSQLREQHKKILLLREISTLKLLGDNKHVTELYDVIDCGDRIWVIIEYASGGELFDFVKAKSPLPDSVAREVFRPIVKVVAYMHSLKLVHRDLKLENVLLDNRGHIKLADFGFSRYYDQNDGLIDSVCGTAQYSPPEVVNAVPYNPIYADSWSLGVILYIELCGDFPFKGLSTPEVLRAIMKAELHIPPIPTELATDLIKRLLNPNPSERLSPAEMMKHPWINKNRIPKPPKKDHSLKISRAAMQELKNLGIVKEGQEGNLDADQMICYRLTRRKFQLGIMQLPAAAERRPQQASADFPGPIPMPSHRGSSLPYIRAKQYPLGMPNGNLAQERIGKIDSVIRVKKLKSSATGRAQWNAQHSAPPKIRDIRRGQTMRFMSLLKTDPDLPILNCQHTTLDEPEVLRSKLFQFMQKEEDVDIDIITEYDFSLYCKLNGTHEVYFSLTVGCVHRGFGLIGFTLERIRGDRATFDDFEQRLSTFLGF